MFGVPLIKKDDLIGVLTSTAGSAPIHRQAN